MRCPIAPQTCTRYDNIITICQRPCATDLGAFAASPIWIDVTYAQHLRIPFAELCRAFTQQFPVRDRGRTVRHMLLVDEIPYDLTADIPYTEANFPRRCQWESPDHMNHLNI